MADVGFPQRLWGKADLGGRLALLGFRWIVCVYAQRKYGPHGELFFFLIQEERATVPGSFSPFFNADIRTPSSLLMSSRSVRSLPYTLSRKKEETVLDVTSRVWEMNGKWASQRAQCGRVKAKLGRKTKVCLPMALVKALCASMRCTASGCMGLVRRSLFPCRIGSFQRWH